MVYLAEDLFLVDLEADFLADVKDFTNTIVFSQMEQERGAGFYRLLYDRSSKNLFRLTPAVRELPPNVELLELPDKSWLDPYRYYVSRGMKPELVPETLLRYARLPKRAKALVKANFSGHTYFSDYRQLAFIDPLNPANKLDFQAFAETYKGEIMAYYDPLSRQIAPANQKGAVPVMLPHFKDLDPEGWRQLEEIRTEVLLNQSIAAPAQMEPLGETLRKLTRKIRSGEFKPRSRPR